MPLHGTVVCYARAFFRQTSAWLSTWIQSLLHQCASLSGRPLFSCSGVYRPVCPSTYPSTTSDEIERRVGRQRSSCLCISPLLSYSGLFYLSARQFLPSQSVIGTLFVVCLRLCQSVFVYLSSWHPLQISLCAYRPSIHASIAYLPYLLTVRKHLHRVKPSWPHTLLFLIRPEKTDFLSFSLASNSSFDILSSWTSPQCLVFEII